MSNQPSRIRLAGILVASAMAGFAAVGDANAAGTDAGTSVSNTFTLDYQVSSVSQTQITNSGSPTTFTVDRIVDLTVTSQGDTNVAPAATGQTLVYGVRNDGNDNQRYTLDLSDVGSDDFDATPYAVVYYVDAGSDGIFTPGVDDAGAGTSHTPNSGDNTTDVAPDATIWVVISATIPGGAADGDTDGIILLADSLNPGTSLDASYSGTPNTATAAEAGANNQNGEAQNVLADAAGDAAADNATDGSHSDTGTYIVASADLSASKAVAVIATDSTAVTCATDPALAGNQYASPGACIEYVITVANAVGAAATATNINIADLLPADITFVAASQSSFSVAGTLLPAAAPCAKPCTVSLTNASLAAGATATLTIRATVD